MAEYIEKQLVLSKSQQDYLEGRYDYDDFVLVSDIESIPPADVRPVVRAVWQFEEHGPEDYEQFWRCPVCAEKTYFITNYCPNCGADMRGGDAE